MSIPDTDIVPPGHDDVTASEDDHTSTGGSTTPTNSDSDSVVGPKLAVESSSHSSIEASGAKSPSHPTLFSHISNLSDLILHSPSQIIGTPFDVGPSRFEYPFPELSDQSSDFGSPLSSSLPTLPSVLPSISNSATRPSFSIYPQPPPLPHLSHSSPISPVLPQSGRFSPTHPKLRPAKSREPPVPPGIVQKRRKLELHGRSVSANAVVSDGGSNRSFGMALSMDTTTPVHPDGEGDGSPGQSDVMTPETEARSIPAEAETTPIQVTDIDKQDASQVPF